ncbi:MAG: fumarylacetoacetate hydrolase family protein [Nitrospinae bacterium]|nr:fumarylacetoacetate hydrolase family protein [Nitrospinota bacterium]
MKIGLIEINRQPRVCVARDSNVILLHEAYGKFRKKRKLPPLPFHAFTHAPFFIEHFPEIKKILPDIILLAEEEKEDSLILPLSRVKWKAPVPKPGTIYCLARNYADHIMEFNEKVMEQDKMTPPIFIKPQTCVTGPGGPVVLPRVGRQIDWEAELAVVIGKKAKYVPTAKALQYVFGYTCMMDISERCLKIRERTEDRGRDKFFDWLNGKWMDTFAPLGPWVVTRDEIPDPQDLNITLSVNGDQKQNGHTGQMIFSVAETISYLSQIVTLMPGDIISTGTPSGVGAPKGTFLKHGDTVEMNIGKVGSLRVRVKGEAQ